MWQTYQLDMCRLAPIEEQHIDVVKSTMRQATGRDSVQLSFGCKSFVHTVEIVQTTSSDRPEKFKLQLVCAVPHFVPELCSNSNKSKYTPENVSVACEPVDLTDVLAEHIQ